MSQRSMFACFTREPGSRHSLIHVHTTRHDDIKATLGRNGKSDNSDVSLHQIWDITIVTLHWRFTWISGDSHSCLSLNSQSESFISIWGMIIYKWCPWPRGTGRIVNLRDGLSTRREAEGGQSIPKVHNSSCPPRPRAPFVLLYRRTIKHQSFHLIDFNNTHSIHLAHKARWQSWRKVCGVKAAVMRHQRCSAI